MKDQGLHDLVIGDVDRLLRKGLCPADVLTELRRLYFVNKDFTLLALLPDDHSKIKNRMLSLSKKSNRAAKKLKVQQLSEAGPIFECVYAAEVSTELNPLVIIDVVETSSQELQLPPI